MTRVQTIPSLIFEFLAAFAFDVVVYVYGIAAALTHVTGWENFSTALGAVLAVEALLLILAAILIFIQKTWAAERAITVELWTPLGWEVGDGVLRVRFSRWAFVVVRLG